MRELTGESRGVVEALLAAPVAWQSPIELARALGRDVEETTDLIAALDADGWLAAWDRGAELVVTLSVAAAARLGVRLVEVGADEVPRWARHGDPEPPRPRASGVFRGERAAMLDLVVDPSASVDLAFERAEGFAKPTDGLRTPAAGVRSGVFPLPTLLIGSGLTPWPGPGDGRKASCPGCRSRRLRPSAYCLCCDRWGHDHLLGDEPPPRPVPRRDPADDARRFERDRQGRKRKRRARSQGQGAAHPSSGPKSRPRPPRIVPGPADEAAAASRRNPAVPTTNPSTRLGSVSP